MSDNMKKPTNRRDFLKIGGASVLGAIVASKIALNSENAFAQAGKVEPVKESDPQAQALGYVTDAKKVDTKKYPKRAGAEGAKQFCYNCQFYQAKGDAKASKEAPCTLFAGKTVSGQGWCNSWTQNPAVKG